MVAATGLSWWLVAAPSQAADSPVNTVPPSISGTPQQGQTLTVVPGSWTNGPTLLSYQWGQCSSGGCAAIAGATAPTYTPTAADVGHTIVVQETARNAAGPGGPASSNQTAVVTPLQEAPIGQSVVPALGPLAPSNLSPPMIFGVAALGQTLTDANGFWTNSPTSFSYVWRRCDSSGRNCTPIAGATSQTYILTVADLRRTVRVQETAINLAGPGGSVVSAPTPVVTQNASSTSLFALPNAPVTNQGVTLVATVTSSSSAAPPSGAVTFISGGGPIHGCAFLPVAALNQSVNVTCPISFSAAVSPQQLMAVFTPTTGSSVAGSTSPTDNVVIGHDSTSTFLQVSNPTVNLGTSATYTATVRPSDAGLVQPSGSVEFLDGGKPIASCSSQSLTTAGAFFTATCKLTYRQTGMHRITARYGGDASFSGSSSSPAQPVGVRKLGVRVLGAVTSTMQWSFHYTRAYTRVLALVVNQISAGATVLVTCHGRGCPFAKRATAVTITRCKSRRGHPCPVQHSRRIDLMPRFRKHDLHVGAQITVELTRPNWIGKHYLFVVRAGQAPRIWIACLAPGRTRPGVGC